MRLLLDSIHDALEKDCLVPALISALTVPDAMGQCLYPEIVQKKPDSYGKYRRDIGKQYARWFDEWIAADAFLFPAPDKDKPRRLSEKTFDGKACYQLRCSLLHSGDYDVSPSGARDRKDGTYEYKFELRLHACDGMVVTWANPSNPGTKPNKQALYIVDVETLSKAICDGAERCLEANEGEVHFPSLHIVDLAAWAERMRNPSA